jgi:4-amino-4-deoxy-L-arabinose transferase-like glycosyltransferase
MRSHRFAHYALLLAVTAGLTLPNLGATSLWDVDEGVNAGCTKEMLEAGTWVVPTFNGELRTAKPVLLYWVQRASFLAFGVGEWSARLPAVLLAMGTVLLAYELGRRMFGAATGLLGGLVLASAIEFCKLAHAATPDAPLIFFTVLTFFLFWVGHEDGGRWWFGPAAVASGLATLTKGPVGLALPGLVVLLYFAWNRELRRLLDWRLIGGILLWVLVAVPWYGLVISETRGAYLAFFTNENANRFLNPMEGHRGPVVYYLGALVAFFAPWCAFLGGTVWYAVKGARGQSPPTAVGGLSTEQRANRFLLCWTGAYLVFFSAAATKLPNYIAPLYPAVALLTARFLVRWRDGALQPSRWVMPAAAGGVAVAGVVVAVGLLVAGGVIPVPAKGLRVLPAVAPWAGLGLVLVAGAAAMGWCLRTGNRAGCVTATTVAAVVFVGLMAAFPAVAVDRYKAPKELVAAAGVHQPGREVRLASLDYTQPSVTFYAGRRVERLFAAAAASEFLAMPLPAYLFVPEPVWAAQLAGKVPTPHRVAARRYDLLRNCDILVVTNE